MTPTCWPQRVSTEPSKSGTQTPWQPSVPPPATRAWSTRCPGLQVDELNSDVMRKTSVCFCFSFLKLLVVAFHLVPVYAEVFDFSACVSVRFQGDLNCIAGATSRNGAFIWDVRKGKIITRFNEVTGDLSESLSTTEMHQLRSACFIPCLLSFGGQCRFLWTLRDPWWTVLWFLQWWPLLSSPSMVKTVFSVSRGAIKTPRGSLPAVETDSGECLSPIHLAL